MDSISTPENIANLQLLEERVDELSAQLVRQERLHDKQVAKLQNRIAELSHTPELQKPAPEPVSNEVQPTKAPPTVAFPAAPDLSEQRRLSREAARGEFHEQFTFKGRLYHAVTISRVTDVGVEVRHQSGRARWRFVDLPESWQERFFYDLERAVAVLSAERRREEREAKRLRLAMVKREKENYDRAVAAEKHRRALELAEAKRPVHITQVKEELIPPEPAVVEVPIISSPVVIHSHDPCPKPVVCPPKLCPPVIRKPVVPRPVCPPVIRQPVVRTPVIRHAPVSSRYVPHAFQR